MRLAYLLSRILTALFVLSSFYLKAQSLKAYHITVKTTRHRLTGVLQKIDTSTVVLQTRSGLVSVPVAGITKIIIREQKKAFRSKRVLTYDPMNEEAYETQPNGPRKRKDGQEDPTPGQQLAGHVSTGVLNGMINLLRLPFHAINPALAKVKIREHTLPERIARELNFYSIAYQQAALAGALPVLK
ncbi:hypothetical protein [Pedobacter sp. SYP-B3415]|uniref:hypothetical protein n=1 Tax=Pedobacter sp. SYP-B3415 TaxID=2496641 RepID=UPI00101E18CB|nr:hypothetical protein [Pedobacter sp. SYP-B3415]